jgi:hypothetical protein
MNARIRRGIFWYTPESYERMRGIAQDSGSFTPAFEKWEAGLQARLEKSPDDTVEYVKIVAEIDDFLSWCAERGLDADAAARKAYADEMANDPASLISPEMQSPPHADEAAKTAVGSERKKRAG